MKKGWLLMLTKYFIKNRIAYASTLSNTANPITNITNTDISAAV